MNELVAMLNVVKGKDVFIRTEPDIVDFTNPNQQSLLIVSGGSQKVGVPLNWDRKDFRYTLMTLKNLIGGKEQIILGWNIKNFFTYIKARSQELDVETDFHFDGGLIDLKIFERYAGIKLERPTTYGEASARFKKVRQTDAIAAFVPYYQQIYLPLMKEVIPSIETCRLADTSKKQGVYPYYELEGQINGRMKCSGAFRRSYVPHNMSSQIKERLAPSEESDKLFFYFDYSHMEVSVLQWLSKDERLGEVLKSGRDLYEAIWETISGLPCNEKRRKICKGIFLPVVYGQGYRSLAKRLEIREDIAKSLVDRTHNSFPTAFRWVKNQRLDEDGYATDAFGRRRKFEFDEAYKVRNFAIQAPASLICLYKLVRLHEELKDSARIAFHIHDGYGVLVSKDNWKTVYKTATASLEREDELFNGLKLRCACEAGQNLNKLSSISLKK